MNERKRKTEKSGDLVLIGDYLRNTAEPVPVGGGVRWPQVLLDAIGRYALYPGQPGLMRFADDLKHLTGQLDDQSTSSSTGTVAEATVSLLGEHRKAKDELDQKQLDEIQQLVVLFNRSLAALTQGSHRSVSRLLTLETDLRLASGLSDLAALRVRLASVMDFVRREREEVRSRSNQVLEMLRKDFRQTQSSLLECGVGIPGREQAITTLRRVWRDDSVGVIVRLDQMALVSERHGVEAAQRLLLAVMAAISDQIGLPHSTFHWGSSALFLLLERTGDREQARSLIRQKAALVPAAYTVEVAARKTLFRCPHNWFVLGSDEEGNESAAIARFESFLRSAPGCGGA